MKTAGELLKEKRLQKELALNDISRKIKIKVEYLEAIENSKYSALPSATFTKGFLKNYANFLRVNPETVLAMFRRDFEENEAGEIVPRGLVKPLSGKRKIPSANTMIIAVAVAVFVSFLGFQLLNWLRLPRLEIVQPVNGEVYGEKITVKGKSDKDAVVSINGQKVILNQEGEFSLDLLYPSGSHSVIIEAVSRQGKVRLLERNFTVSK